MRSASELVRATRPFAREVRWRSWWHLWSTLAALAGLLGLAGMELPWGWRLPASALSGLAMVRMFAIYHDHQHGAILLGPSRCGAVGVRAAAPDLAEHLAADPPLPPWPQRSP